jgi:hypothetical protein
MVAPVGGQPPDCMLAVITRQLDASCLRGQTSLVAVAFGRAMIFQ